MLFKLLCFLQSLLIMKNRCCIHITDCNLTAYLSLSFQLDTLMLSCGMADMIATSASGRNYKVGATFVLLLAIAHNLRYNDHGIVCISDSSSSAGSGAKEEEDVHTSATSENMTAVSNKSNGSATAASPNFSKLSPSEWKTHIQTLWSKVDDIVCSGQKPQGVWTCEQVVECIHRKYKHDAERVFMKYPLFSRIYEVVVNGELPTKLFQWK